MDPVVRKLRLPAAAGLCAVLLLWASSSAAQDVRGQGAGETRLIDLVDSGHVADAEDLLARGDLPATAAYQRERMRRIRMDFSLDEAAAKTAVIAATV